MTTGTPKRAILVDMQSMLEEWNQQAEQFGYSGSGDFAETGRFEVQEYNGEGDVIGTYSARVIID